MKVPALILAGGKGSRICSNTEKPLLLFLGKPLIDRVVEAAKSARNVSQIYVVTSKNTPQTEERCLKNGWRVLKTNGEGYHNDLKQAIIEGKLNSPVLTIPADLPALTGEFIDKIITLFEERGKNALAVFIPLEKRKKMELSVSSKDEFEGVMYAVSGVNIINGKKILAEGKIDTAALVTDEIEVLFNINTQKDLKIAEKNLKNHFS
ncbi:MAG TPA: NTP transferase domain-containing protein [Candidatus Glassbacteria bacterium]|nr:NTP transferase domain-containing protein [Candidatus Glassbacteria bacterium]